MDLSNFILVMLVMWQGQNVSSEFCDNEEWSRIGYGLITDNILFVGGTIERLLDLMWSHCVTEEIMATVEEEELEDLRQSYEGFKDTLERIRDTGQEDKVDVMFCFYMDLNNEHFKFAENDLGSAVVYFRDYAVVKITILKILVKLNPGDSSYEDLLEAEAKRLVAAGERMIVEVPEIMWEKNGSWWKKDKQGIAHYREIVKNHLLEPMEAWRSLYPESHDNNHTTNDWDSVGLGFGSGSRRVSSMPCAILNIYILAIKSLAYVVMP